MHRHLTRTCFFFIGLITWGAPVSLFACWSSSRAFRSRIQEGSLVGLHLETYRLFGCVSGDGHQIIQEQRPAQHDNRARGGTETLLFSFITSETSFYRTLITNEPLDQGFTTSNDDEYTLTSQGSMGCGPRTNHRQREPKKWRPVTCWCQLLVINHKTKDHRKDTGKK